MLVIPLVPAGARFGDQRVATAAGAVVPMLPGDPLLGPSRGNADSAIAFAMRYGARRPGDVSAYISEVYRLAPQLGLDPAIVVAQSALETDTWRTDYWANHLNPAGIGITYWGQPSYTWSNGTDAARGHLVHLALYATGPINPGHILYPYRHLDPRYDAALAAGYAGSTRTIADLTGRWATDPVYHQKIAGRGNDILHRYRIAGFSSSGGSTGAAQTDDASAATGWRSTASNPTTEWLQLDLGGAVQLGRVRWLVNAPGVTDKLTVSISLDGGAWSPLGTFGSGPTGQWQGIMPGGAPSARYVRFTVENPLKKPVLGTIAEVQFWPPSTVAYPFLSDTTPPGPTASPSPSGSPSASPSGRPGRPGRTTPTPAASTPGAPTPTATTRPVEPTPVPSRPGSRPTRGPQPQPTTAPQPSTAPPPSNPTPPPPPSRPTRPPR